MQENTKGVIRRRDWKYKGEIRIRIAKKNRSLQLKNDQQYNDMETSLKDKQ